MKLYVDPPEGWRYGFPKVFDLNLRGLSDNEAYAAKIEWFLKNGYPQSLIDQGMLKWTRYFEEND